MSARLGDAIRDKSAIVGVGETEFSKNIGRSEREIACEAVAAALADAGIPASEVDGVVSFNDESNNETELARNLGFGDLIFWSRVASGGGAGAGTVGHAAMAVATGQAEVVVAFRSRNRGSGKRPWSTGPLEWQGFTQPNGLVRPVDEIAMVTRRYMHEFGVTREQLAEVALAFRAHAHNNPRALMGGRPLDLETYLSARWISEPLCLFDCSLETDGAVAVVVTSAERARDCSHPAVYIHSFAQGQPRQYQAMGNFHAEDPLWGCQDVTAQALWARSELGPADVDVAQIYDVFSILVLECLESYGFCKRGEAADFCRGGALRVDTPGGLPVNTSGGSLSEAYVHGYNLISEGVKQLRGTSPNQVDDARVCLVASAACAPSSAVLLRR
jgi:acetyl-CoA acetyltransferase